MYAWKCARKCRCFFYMKMYGFKCTIQLQLKLQQIWTTKNMCFSNNQTKKNYYLFIKQFYQEEKKNICLPIKTHKTSTILLANTQNIKYTWFTWSLPITWTVGLHLYLLLFSLRCWGLWSNIICIYCVFGITRCYVFTV